YFVFVPGVDGWAARRLQQTSRLGAWLNVVIDNLGHGMLWNMLYDVSSVSRESPGWVRAVMAKGFKTPLGILTIAGLYCLTCVAVLLQTLYAQNWLQILVLAAGCLLGVAVEMWCIITHLRFLVDQDEKEKKI
ncbi:hypothetical protein cypCar_00010630, partial [Cyprinus carpio]